MTQCCCPSSASSQGWVPDQARPAHGVASSACPCKLRSDLPLLVRLLTLAHWQRSCCCVYWQHETGRRQTVHWLQKPPQLGCCWSKHLHVEACSHLPIHPHTLEQACVYWCRHSVAQALKQVRHSKKQTQKLLMCGLQMSSVAVEREIGRIQKPVQHETKIQVSCFCKASTFSWLCAAANREQGFEEEIHFTKRFLLPAPPGAVQK